MQPESMLTLAKLIQERLHVGIFIVITRQKICLIIYLLVKHSPPPSFWQNNQHHSSRKCCRKKKAKTNLRHKHSEVLPTSKYQMSHYVIIENLIIKQNHMKKQRCCQKKISQNTET